MITNFDNYILNEEEASIRFPNSLEYWREKGKRGKDVIIYTHDDLDGIFSGIVMKEYLESRGFNIAGYGIVNYTDGWKVFTIDKTYINVCVDYAEDNPDLDLYIDHHMEEGEVYKKSDQSIKMKSDSCYYLVCRLLGIPTDDLILSVITMIDAARYDDYNVDIKTILNFNLQDIIKSKNARLVFAGAFNQLIKRSDYRTIIEVVHNGTLSVYKIFNLFKKIYPLNNVKMPRGTTPEEKDDMRRALIALDKDNPDRVKETEGVPAFVPDSKDRINKMMAKTSGRWEKPFILSLEDFINFYWSREAGKFEFDGFVVIKNLVYVPVGTWANALRARALIEKVLGRHDKNIQFILLDYGSSLQITSYKNIDTIEDLPTLRGGEILNDLDKYTRFLGNFVLPREFGFQYQGLKCGGHKGIGNLSNLLGMCQKEPFRGIKFMDLMKNWIIHDVTELKWKLNMPWNINPPVERPVKQKEINKKVMMVDDIRNVK